MKTDPIRWVCGVCFRITRAPLEVFFEGGFGYNWTPGRNIDPKPVLKMPQCCGKDLLLAGEPKLDVHGLRKKGSWIDPVENLITDLETPNKPQWRKMAVLD